MTYVTALHRSITNGTQPYEEYEDCSRLDRPSACDGRCRTNAPQVIDRPPAETPSNLPLAGNGDFADLNYAPQIDQGLVVDLVLSEQFGAVAEVPKKPAQLPHGPGGAVGSTDLVTRPFVRPRVPTPGPLSKITS